MTIRSTFKNFSSSRTEEPGNENTLPTLKSRQTVPDRHVFAREQLKNHIIPNTQKLLSGIKPDISQITKIFLQQYNKYIAAPDSDAGFQGQIPTKYGNKALKKLLRENLNFPDIQLRTEIIEDGETALIDVSHTRSFLNEASSFPGILIPVRCFESPFVFGGSDGIEENSGISLTGVGSTDDWHKIDEATQKETHDASVYLAKYHTEKFSETMGIVTQLDEMAPDNIDAQILPCLAFDLDFSNIDAVRFLDGFLQDGLTAGFSISELLDFGSHTANSGRMEIIEGVEIGWAKFKNEWGEMSKQVADNAIAVVLMEIFSSLEKAGNGFPIESFPTLNKIAKDVQSNGSIEFQKSTKALYESLDEILTDCVRSSVKAQGMVNGFYELPKMGSFFPMRCLRYAAYHGASVHCDAQFIVNLND